MTSSAQRDLYLVADPEVYGWVARFYQRLDENYEMVFLFTVENPSPHFLDRYMGGAAKGYEIRLYQLVP